jgi:hypothetical protein
VTQLLPYSKLHSYLCGIDRLTGEIKGFPFEKAEPQSVQGAGGAIQSLEFNKVESYEHLATALSVDAKAEARFGLFGADASFAFDKTMSINSYSIFVYAVAKVERAFDQVEDPKYKPEAAELAKGAGGAFREAYGDWFVRGIATGGELLSLIEIRTKDEAQRTDIDAALSGSYGISFSAEAETKQTFETATSGTTTHIVQHQVGGTPVSISNPADVFDKLRAFVEELSAEDCETAVPYQVGYVDYSTVPIPGAPSWIDLEQAEYNLSLLAQLRTASLRALADVQYVLTNQTEFVWDAHNQDAWVKSLNEASRAFIQHIDTIQQTASGIAKDATKTIADLGKLQAIQACELPPRKPGERKTDTPVTPTPEPTSTGEHFVKVHAELSAAIGPLIAVPINVDTPPTPAEAAHPPVHPVHPPGGVPQ